MKDLHSLINSVPRVHLLESDFLREMGVEVYVLRLDELHPIISGNKWYKLKYNLDEARRGNGILTFGGAFSNHIYAAAWACNQLGIPSVGIIRGEETQPLNNIMKSAKNWGMEIKYISRSDYRKKAESKFLDDLKAQYANFHIIPEGGANEIGVRGAEEILSRIEIYYSHIACSIGTGAMMGGLVNSVKHMAKVIGYSSLKGGAFLVDEVRHFVRNNEVGFEISIDYHFGGYAKSTPELEKFIEDFKNDYDIQLDWVYNGKMFYGLFHDILKGKFEKGAKIIAVHCGGIQK